MSSFLIDRAEKTVERFDKLKERLISAENRSKNKACVYVTGSFGRGEASKFSDLDLFIVGKSTKREGTEERLLTRLEEICVKAELIHVTRELKFPEFSGDGEYLKHYTKNELVKALGTEQDDYINTFTARLLLLLESKPLIEENVYRHVIEDVIAAYWRDYEDHEKDFMPAYLANDILRLWRTFCVNYEARTKTEPEEKKIKRRIKNYKLKHSRLLTCYSALIYLLAIYTEKKTVSTEDAIQMISHTPTGRVMWLKEQKYIPKETKSIADEVIEKYTGFLQETDKNEADLILKFSDPEKSKSLMASAFSLGDSVSKLLASIGTRNSTNSFYRLLIV